MTTDERIENLEKGLASARRFNRWLLAAVGLALGVWILAGTFGPTMAAAPAGGAAVKEVRANRFVVEDTNGKTRASLDVFNDNPRLVLYDEIDKPLATLGTNKDGGQLSLGGKSIAVLGTNKTGATLILMDTNRKLQNVMLGAALGLVLTDENGKNRAELLVSKDGPTLVLKDDAGKGRVGLCAPTDGPALVLADENGKASVMVNVGKDGAALNLYDKNEKPRVALGVSGLGTALGLCYENGKPSAVLQAGKDGPSLILYDENGKGRATLIQNVLGPMLALSDDNGKPIWHAP